MTRIRMTKLESTHNNLRTAVIEGKLLGPLEVGMPIRIESKPIKMDMEFRYVTTTQVESIEGDIYKTKNSTYRIEVLE